MRTTIRLCLLAACLGAVGTTPAMAADEPMPQVLQIYREEVKPGKGAAHEANEAAWAAAFARAKMQDTWVGMTTLTGPTEAWFLMPLGSLADWEKLIKAADANEALSAEVRKFSAQDGDLLNRSTGIVASYRPAISYKPRANVADMRYMRVTLSRVKPGYANDFIQSWTDVVAAHEKAKLDEHWAFYQVTSGMPDGTFLFLQTFKDLAGVDELGPMHRQDAYRDAVGEAGRARQREMARAAVDFSQDMILIFNPKMSNVPEAWRAADPAFWTPKPPAPAKK